MHDYDLILMLAAGFSAALILGYITQRLGLSPIVGYLLAGIAVGPYTPGFVADVGLAGQLAEIGVILLMFGVGLHFRMQDLLAVRSIAVPGAIGQIFVSTALGALVGVTFGWSVWSSIVLGVAASVASTVVLVRVLTDHDELETEQGRIAVGWLVVEDIFTVLVLVLLPAASAAHSGGGESGNLFGSLALAMLKLCILGFVILVVGAKVIPWLLKKVAQSRSRELFTLAILALAIAIATGSAVVFDASFALGAFLAGMVVGQSKAGHQAAADALPMRDAFAVLFFVSVGMLFDPLFVIEHPWLVLSLLAVVIVGKPLAAFAIVLGLGYSVRAAIAIAIALAQIGEFTFILSSSALELGVFSSDGQNSLIAVALVSISLNPLLFGSALKFEAWLQERPWLWSIVNRRSIRRAQKANALAISELEVSGKAVDAIVVGYGPVGRTVTRILSDFTIRPVVVELNFDTVDALTKDGIMAVYGDASSPEILVAAGISKARFLVITIPDLIARIPIIVAARQLNSEITVISRARYLAEQSMLEELGVASICYEEGEAAVGLSRFVLEQVGVEEQLINAETDRIRAEFAG